MKKTIILILAVLPIVLLVVIAFAGQILSYYQHIPVERLEFVDRLNNAYTEDTEFVVEQGKTKETRIRVYPELATNKKVVYTSQDETICTVDENGVITGLHYGDTTVTAESEDSGKSVVLNVKVKADVPYAVYFTPSELSVLVGEKKELSYVVDAPVAVNKSVTLVSSDPSILSVDENGIITGHAAGEVTVTVTTKSGGLQDTCTVKVEEGELPLSFALDGVPGLNKNPNGIYVALLPTVELLPHLQIAEGVDPATVSLRITSGTSIATLDGGVLTFTGSGLVTVRAYIGDEASPTFFIEVDIGCIVD